MKSESFHKAVSLIFSPVFTCLYVASVFSFFSPVGLGSLTSVYSFSIGFLFFWVVPTIGIYICSGKKWNIFERRKRNRPYTVAVSGYALASLIFWYFGTQAMLVLSISYLAFMSFLMIVNFRWKISAHTAGVAGPVTALTYVFGLEFSFLYLFVPVVAYSRHRLKSHDFSQLAVGAVIPAVITFLIYFFLW